MTKEFIPYEQALELKEMGFDEPTSFYWEDNVIRPLPMKDEVGAFHFNRHTHTENEWICAPLYQQAFCWLDDSTEYRGFVVPSIKEGHYDWVIRTGDEEEIQCEEYYLSRREAELACLKRLIEIVKNK